MPCARAILLTTGTELLLGDIQEAHLGFIAREIFPLGLRIAQQRAVPDGLAIRDALVEIFPRSEIVFVTGGLGPTTDDLTCQIAAEVLGLELLRDDRVLAAILERFAKRGLKFTQRIERQALIPKGAEALLNENGTAPGIYLPENINPAVPSPHLFLLPGPPRELRPMFRESVMPILRKIGTMAAGIERRFYKIAEMGESSVEEAIGERVLAIPDIELGYCARPGEVDVRIIGERSAVEQADAIIRSALGLSIFSMKDENLEQVLVQLLAGRRETLSLAESCTGGLLANRITNVPGASEVFLAGYVTYANAAKIDVLRVDARLVERHGAVSEEVARAMAEGARGRAGSTYGLSTTGIAGPGGGSEEKPVGTVYVGLAGPEGTVAKRFFFPNDRETFKQMTAQAGFDLLRRRLIEG